MKTTILLFALIFGCIIPTYSQINRHRKTNATPDQFSILQNKKKNDFGNYKFDDKFSSSLRDVERDSFTMSPTGPAPNKNRREIYSGDNMPCFKPAGMFTMRVYKPDSTVTYTMLFKQY